MLRWLTFREYNRFDLLWIVLFALAWNDREWVAAAVAVIVGGVLSGFLEAWNKHREESP